MSLDPVTLASKMFEIVINIQWKQFWYSDRGKVSIGIIIFDVTLNDLSTTQISYTPFPFASRLSFGSRSNSRKCWKAFLFTICHIFVTFVLDKPEYRWKGGIHVFSTKLCCNWEQPVHTNICIDKLPIIEFLKKYLNWFFKNLNE